MQCLYSMVSPCPKMLHNKWNIIMDFMFLWIKWKPSNIGRFGLQFQSPLQHRTTTRFQDSAHPPYGFTGSQYGWKAHRDRCFGSPPSSQASFPSGTNIREGNVQWMYISDMFIGHFPSSSYSPHICGLVVIWGRFRVWYFIFHILGYFRNSKDKCSITSETLLWVLCSCG